MAATSPRHSKEEIARSGDAIYEPDIAPMVEKDREGQFAVIDVETGAYEIDADEMVASDRSLARVPNAQMWLRKVGSRYVRRFGGRDRRLVQQRC